MLHKRAKLFFLICFECQRKQSCEQKLVLTYIRVYSYKQVSLKCRNSSQINLDGTSRCDIKMTDMAFGRTKHSINELDGYKVVSQILGRFPFNIPPGTHVPTYKPPFVSQTHYPLFAYPLST